MRHDSQILGHDQESQFTSQELRSKVTIHDQFIAVSPSEAETETNFLSVFARLHNMLSWTYIGGGLTIYHSFKNIFDLAIMLILFGRIKMQLI